MEKENCDYAILVLRMKLDHEKQELTFYQARSDKNKINRTEQRIQEIQSGLEKLRA